MNKMYTIEDMREAIYKGWEFHNELESLTDKECDNYIQTLPTKQLPKDFIPIKKSIEDIEKELGIFGHDEGLTELDYQNYIKDNPLLKTITNSDNKQELVGEYKY